MNLINKEMEKTRQELDRGKVTVQKLQKRLTLSPSRKNEPKPPLKQALKMSFLHAPRFFMYCIWDYCNLHLSWMKKMMMEADIHLSEAGRLMAPIRRSSCWALISLSSAAYRLPGQDRRGVLVWCYDREKRELSTLKNPRIANSLLNLRREP